MNIRVNQAKTILESLKDFDDSSLTISKNSLAHIVTAPDMNQIDVVEVVKSDEVEVIKTKRDYGVCYVSGGHVPPFGMGRLRYDFENDDDSIIRVHINSGLFGAKVAEHWMTTREDGVKIAPDMSVMLDENGQPDLTHSGSGSLFDIVRDARNKNVDCYVIRFGGMSTEHDEDDVLVNAHRRSGAPITVMVEESLSPHDVRPVLIRTSDGVGLYDPRDVSTTVESPRLVESGAYVVSTSLLDNARPFYTFTWTYRRRRYHLGGKIWYQIERDMCELTRLFVTNYVRLS